MATFAAEIADAIVPLQCFQSFVPIVVEDETKYVQTLFALSSDSRTIATPPAGIARTGNVAIGPWDRFKDRLLYKPRTFDTGIVTDDLTFDTEVWNVFKDSTATIVDIQVQDSEGYSTEDDSPFLDEGDALLPYQYGKVRHLVDGTGPVEIAYEVIIVFNLGNVLATLTGIRGTVITAIPAQGGYQEGRTWFTRVFKSGANYEYRESALATGDVPKRYVSFSYKSLTEKEQAAFEAVLRYATKVSVLAPLWFSHSELLTAITGATNTVNIDTTNREFVVGDHVLILNRKTLDYVVRRVESMTDSSIVVNTNVENFPASTTVVIPLMIATPGTTNTLSSRTNRYADGTIEFEEITT